MPKRRHEAIRTCVACRQPAGKRGLVRLCRDGAGLIQVDPGGRAPGGDHLDAGACLSRSLSKRFPSYAVNAVRTYLPVFETTGRGLNF